MRDLEKNRMGRGQTDRHTDRRTCRLSDQLSPGGRVGENFRPNLLMFLDHQVSCDQNELLKHGLKKLVGWIVKASEIAIEAGQFHVFSHFLAICF